MPANAESKVVAFSQKLFERFLTAYPKRHREAYGTAMAQLFRDQCRDAWQDARSWGVVLLWLRVLPDLVKTSVVERLASLRERKSMLERISDIQRWSSFPGKAFAIAFAVVFALVFGYNTISTFLLPDSFASSARLRLEPTANSSVSLKNDPAGTYYDPYLIQTEFEIIRSEVILSSVVQDLNLNVVWGEKAGVGQLKTAESLARLKGRMDLRPVRNTSLIEIRAYSEDRQEAAEIANAVADNYRAYRLASARRAAHGGNDVVSEEFANLELRLAGVQSKMENLGAGLGIADANSGNQQKTAEQAACLEAGRELADAGRLLGALEKRIAGEYVDAQHAKSFPVEIVDRAIPAVLPAWPNRLLKIFFGAIWGSVIGLAVAGSVATIAIWVLRQPSVKSATP